MAKTGTFSLPGAYNTYVPNPDATGNLIITFSRNPADFPLPNYVQYRPVSKSTGLYLRINEDEAARILDVDIADYVWPDGADAPKKAMTADFRYEQYRAEPHSPCSWVSLLWRKPTGISKASTRCSTPRRP